MDNVLNLFQSVGMLPPRNPDEILKARGADTRPANRFDRLATEREHDGWDTPEETRLLRTEVTDETPRTIITRNTSPDVPFDRSINPYRGCEHGCIYCFARPSHAYWGLSPGLDFETKITAKPDAARLLAAEIAKPSYKVAPIAFGTNTDPYQPIESKRAIMPGLWQVLLDWNHPASLVTRGQTALRDLPLLAEMAARRLIHVGVSITTLDAGLARALEPRAPAPAIRLRMIREMAAAGIQVRVMVAPVIPVLTEPEIEAILTAAREAGAVCGTAGQGFGAGGAGGLCAVEMQLDRGFDAQPVNLGIGAANLARPRHAPHDHIARRVQIPDRHREVRINVVFGALVRHADSTLRSGVMPDHQSDLAHVILHEMKMPRTAAGQDCRLSPA